MNRLLFIRIFLYVAFLGIMGVQAEDIPQYLDIKEGDNVLVSYQIEIAKTQEQKERGLMYRRSLPQNHGMLFVIDPPDVVSFWMRNTIIPLDMIFITEAGIIERIVTREDIRSLERTASYSKVAYVLEVNAKQTQKKGVRRGHRITFSCCVTLLPLHD